MKRAEDLDSRNNEDDGDRRGEDKEEKLWTNVVAVNCEIKTTNGAQILS